MHTRILLFALLVASPALADKEKQTRSQIAADGWIKAMTDPSTIAPSYSKTQPLEYSVQSPFKGCKRFASKETKLTTADDIKALKACFVGTRALVGKTVKPAVYDIKDKEAGLDQSKYLKTAPKGSVLAGAAFNENGVSNLSMTFALGPDYTVLKVWMDYVENDGE